MPMILAVDLGSTNLKAALFDDQGSRIGEGSCPLPYDIHTNHCSELDPFAVEQAFSQSAREALSSGGTREESVRRLSLTSQAQTFCVCNDSGKPLGPFIGWSDGRAASEAEELGEALGRCFHQETGWPSVLGELQLAKALWWQRQHGWTDSHRLMSLPSFLAMRLGCDHVVDSNLAAMSGLFSIPQGDWWEAAMQAVNLERPNLGAVVAPGTPLKAKPGSRSILSGATHLEVVLVGNDHTSGAIGCGCSPSRSVLTLGTAGVFYRHAGSQPGPFSPTGLWGAFPLGGFYELLFIPHACSALDWADSFLFGRVDSHRFVEAARRARPGLSTVSFNPESWGSAAAWSGEAGPEEMAYAVLEGLSSRLNSLVGGSLLHRCQEIIVLGGGSRLDFWVQMIADLTGCPLIRQQADGLLGAALMAGLQPGDLPCSPGDVFLPCASRGEFLRFRLQK